MGTILDLMLQSPILATRDVSRNGRNLDPSQEEAVVDNLTREVPLVQGHLAQAKSIFLISFRLASSFWVFPELYRDVSSPSSDQEQNRSYNHDCVHQSRLGHLLGNAHDAGITNKVVGLCSRSAEDVRSRDFII